MGHLMTLSVMVAACDTITGDFDRIIGIQLDQSPRTVEVGDTLQLTAQAVSAKGDIVHDAAITWALLSVDSGQVGFTVEESGTVRAHAPGNGQVQAQFEDLRSDPITVTSSPAPDSVASDGAIVPFPPTGTSSAPMRVAVFERVTSAGQPTPLPGKPVRYQLVDPAPGTPAAAVLFLLAADTVPEADPHGVTAFSAADGFASASVHVQSGATPPDTITVDATVTTAVGAPVVGSPIRFLVAVSTPL
jgi:hypothetical protein